MSIPNLDELKLLHQNICYAFADPKRIQIIYALAESPTHVTGLAEVLELPQPTVSRHLAILKQRGLVKNERHGAMVIYQLSDERVITVLDTMRSMLKDVFEEKTNTLKA